MDLSPKQYLLIYALIVTPIVISFFVRRKDLPSRLNLTGGRRSRESQLPGQPTEPRPQVVPMAQRPRDSGEYPRPRVQQQKRVLQEDSDRPVEKSLNVLFQWNGHAWDAYEVLGIPAGSSLETVKVAYQEQLTRGGPEAEPFFKTAYETIIRKSSAG